MHQERWSRSGCGAAGDLHAHDLTMWAAGGIVYLSGASGRPDLPPLKTFGQQAGFQADEGQGVRGAHGASHDAAGVRLQSARNIEG